MAILFGTWNNNRFFLSVTYQPCRSLRRRTQPTKRKVEVADDAPRKRRRPSLDANDAAHGHVTKQGTSGNGPSPYARKETSDSSSSSSGSGSNTTSDDSSSDSGSNSDSDSDSIRTSSSSDDEPTPLRPPPASCEHVKKSPRPTYVVFIFPCWKTGHQLGSLPQAHTSPAWIWEAGDACTQRTPSEKASPPAHGQGRTSSSRG